MSTADAELRTYEIKPSAADPAVREYDDPNLILFDSKTARNAPLVVFLPGTGGKPTNARRLLTVVAGQGYRVIGLEYNDTPAVAELCPGNPDLNCSEAFRRMRVFAEGQTTLVQNPAAESIVTRLVQLLKSLHERYPDEAWDTYLSNGEPNWSRIVVSGLSQGAGMAAYIAKLHPVARVVLFSSPWDVAGPNHSPAPWLAMPSKTPLELWYAEYHAREMTAQLIANAYAALRIPQDHIRVFNRDLPRGRGPRGPNPFHGSTIQDPGYADDWRMMFGRPQ